MSLGILVLVYGGRALDTAISEIIHGRVVFELNETVPLGFSTYGMPCLSALLVIAAGWALVKRWWQMLFLICWWFLTRLVVEELHTNFFMGWQHIFDLDLLLPALSLAAVAITCAAAISSRECLIRAARPEDTAHRRWPPGWPLLAGPSLVVIAVILWRIVALAIGPEGDVFLRFLRHLKGGEWAYDADQYSITECAVGMVAAVAVAVGIVPALRGHRLPLQGALVSVAAMTADGVLYAIDLALALDVPWDFPASAPYRSAMFAASAAALAATAWRFRRQPV